MVWDLSKGESIQRLVTKPTHKQPMHESTVTCLCWGYEGNVLFTGSTDMSFIAWRVIRNHLEFVEQTPAHKASVYAVAYDAETHRVATAGRDSIIKVFDVTSLDSLVSQHKIAPVKEAAPEAAENKTTEMLDSSLAGLSLLNDADAEAEDEVAMNNRKREIKNSVSKVALCHSLEGHRGDVLCLAFAKAGRILLSGARDNTIKAWDVALGKVLRDVHSAQGHRGDIEAIAVLPSQQVLTASGDGTVKLWELGADIDEAARAVPTDAMTMEMVGLDKDDDEDEAAAEAAPQSEDAVVVTHRLHTSIACALYNPAKRMLLVAADAPEVAVWAVEDEAWGKLSLVRQFVGHAEQVTALVTLRDCKSPESSVENAGVSVLSASADGRALEHSLGQAALTGLFSHPISVSALVASPCGRLVFVAGGDYVIRVYERSAGAHTLFSAPVAELRGHCGRITALAYEPALRVLASGSQDFHLQLFDVSTLFAASPAPPIQQTATSTPIVVAPRHAASTSPLPVVITTAAAGARVLTPLVRLQPGNGHVLALRFKPDGTALACGLSDHNLHVFSLKRAASASMLSPVGSVKAHTSVVTAVAWGRGDHVDRVYTGSADKTIGVWTVLPSAIEKVCTIGSPAATGHHFSRVVGHFGKITALATSGDGKYLLSASGDETLVAWDGATGAPVASYATLTTDGAFTAMEVVDATIIAGTEKGMLFQFPLYQEGHPAFTDNELLKKK